MAEHLRRGKGRGASADEGMSKSGLARTLCSDKGVKRCGRSCRPRWGHYLRPDPQTNDFSPQEEELIIRLHSAIGSRWSIIAEQLPGRKEGEVKNHWNTKLRKKLREMGIDHVTHKPFSQLLADYVTMNTLPKSPEPISGGHHHPPPGESSAVSDSLSSVGPAAVQRGGPFDGTAMSSFSWQDFLLEEVLMSQETGETVPGVEEPEETGMGLGLTRMDLVEEESFVEGILDKEISMFMELPLELLEDD